MAFPAAVAPINFLLDQRILPTQLKQRDHISQSISSAIMAHQISLVQCYVDAHLGSEHPGILGLLIWAMVRRTSNSKALQAGDNQVVLIGAGDCRDYFYQADTG
jgi:hypothetical protein